VSACRHPPRQWHFGELMPCADPLCSDTCPGVGLVMLVDGGMRSSSARFEAFYYDRRCWVDAATGYKHWFWTRKPAPRRIVGRRRKRPRKKARRRSRACDT
jgi:hypothetical protein